MKLISALGENYDIIMEMVDFLNGDFTYTENAMKIKKSFAKPLDEIILFCTAKALTVCEDLHAVLHSEYPRITLTPVGLGITDIADVEDDEKIRNTIFDTVEKYHRGTVILSSAGRKDITQRIVEAGHIWGFHGYLSITLSPAFHQAKKGYSDLSDYQIVRKHPESLMVNWYPISILLRRKYQLDGHTYSANRQESPAAASHKEPELIQNFPSLYSLPRAIIHRLTSEKIGADRTNEVKDLQWLQAMPKTDLHCHFGGAAGTRELKTIADAIMADNCVQKQWKDEIAFLSKKLRNCSLAEELSKIKGKAKYHPLKYLREYYEGIAPRGVPVFLTNAVQLSVLTENEISHLMRYTHENESGIGGLEAYTAAGNFGGSTLLQTEAAITTAMECLLEVSLTDNIRYLEVRISPMNYCENGLRIPKVMKILLETSERFMRKHPGLMVNFIIMATRHKDKAAITKNISTAIVFSEDTDSRRLKKESPFVPYVCGVDLAGQEKGYNPLQFADLFQPLHHHFIKITIHAGETEGSQNIWEALYPLHAKRIGHGLRLLENPEMMEFLRDLHISVEMCPVSNAKTCGYRDFINTDIISSVHEAKDIVYPLRSYLEEGIGVTINTDNRGINQASLTDEYLKACHLTEGGLSKWDVLKIIRQGFVSGFLPLKQKNILLSQAEQQILSFLIQDFLGA